MSWRGAKVMHPRAVELGALYGVEIHVRSSFGEGPGTVITGGTSLEHLETRETLAGIVHDLDVSRVTLNGIRTGPGTLSRVFAPLAERGISVDVIVESGVKGGAADVAFTVRRADFAEARRLAGEVAGSLGGEVEGEEDLGKVSVVGTGMLNRPVTPPRMFASLGEAGIPIRMVSTSEIQVTCVLPAERVEEAVRVLHRTSNWRREMFSGTFTALVTPFRNGEVDVEALEGMVEFQIQHGVSGLVPCGTTGETPAMSEAEDRVVVETVVRIANGRVPIIAGTGSNSTDMAIKYTKMAQEVGADGSLQVAPYYNKPTQEGLYRHFAAIAESTELPLVLYNIPGRTGVTISAETMARLAEIPNIVGVKDSTLSMNMISDVIRLCGEEFDVLSGDDPMTLPLVALGGRG